MNNLKWMGHTTTILDIQKALRGDSKTCEVNLTTNGYAVRVHRFVLSASSDMLRNLLADVPMGQEATIIVPDMKSTILESVLAFMYMGETCLTSANLSDFLEAINVLGIKSAISFECNAGPLADNDTTTTTTTTTNIVKTISGIQLEPEELIEPDNISSKNLEDQSVLSEQQTTTRDLSFLDVYTEPQQKITYSIEHLGGASSGNEFILTENSGSYTLTQNAKLENSSISDSEKISDEIEEDADADETQIIEDFSSGGDPIIKIVPSSSNTLTTTSTPTPQQGLQTLNPKMKLIKVKCNVNIATQEQDEQMEVMDNSELNEQSSDPISMNKDENNTSSNNSGIGVNDSTIELAVQAVLTEGMSLQKAAQKYDLSKAVLWRRVRKNPNYMKTSRENPVLTLTYERIKTGESLKNISRDLDIPMSAVLAVYLLEESSDDDSQPVAPKRPRIWSKDWCRLRESESFCAKLFKELRAGEPSLYKNFVRMTAEQFDHLLELVTPFLSKADTNMRKSIPASDRLALTLSFLATGDNFSSLQYLFRFPQSTISRIVPEVLDALYKVLVKDFIKMPQNEKQWEEIAREFEECWQFPNCIGAVDGKHVVMVAPPNSGSVYYNYKGTHSIVLMGVADAAYKLLYIDVGRNGKHSDGGVFNRCTFGQAMDMGKLNLPAPKPLRGSEKPMPYVVVADDAFAMRPNVMKPYSLRGLSMVQRVFNYRLSRARRIIENVFGIMSARFRVLRKPIHLDPEKTKKVVLACCVLHNYLMSTNRAKYAPPNSFDQYDDEGNITTAADWRNDGSVDVMLPLEAVRRDCDDAKEIQRGFAAYFVDEGEVEWQYKHL